MKHGKLQYDRKIANDTAACARDSQLDIVDRNAGFFIVSDLDVQLGYHPMTVTRVLVRGYYF